jgi:hypothetical protein
MTTRVSPERSCECLAGKEIDKENLSSSCSSGSFSADESEEIRRLLLADWGDKWGKPLTAAELIEIGGEAFEPLFLQPPIGPIPEYLRSYSFVHACVAEYEDKLEELSEWKARGLDGWLKGKAGKRCTVGRKVYVLRLEEGSSAVERYWFELVEKLG